MGTSYAVRSLVRAVRSSVVLPLALLLPSALLPACGSGQEDDTSDMTSDALTSRPQAARILINEVMANEPGTDVREEMVELVNPGKEDVDLTGYTLSNSVGVRHTFARTVLPAGRAFVVFGGAGPSASRIEESALASTGTLSLANTRDSVTLKDAAGAVVDTMSYSGALGAKDGVSINRSSDGSPDAKAWVLHNAVSGAKSSPGRRSNGTWFGTPLDDPPPVGGTLRIATGNLSSGKLQSYDPGEGARIFRALAPDIALVQELNAGANTDASVRAFVDSAFGPSYVYARQAGRPIPNGVVSRYPITASGVWTDRLAPDRDFVWARIDIPGPHDLWAVSVHLLTSTEVARNAEATALVDYVHTNVPPGDLVVIGGDFNTASTATLAILGAVVDVRAPIPVDQAGVRGTNATRTRQLDWVLSSPSLTPLQVPTRVGPVVAPTGLVFDTRVFSPIADAAPALATDSAAVEMQHMAVVKDFQLAAP
jgi:endonuclease/exonuclease/phosphatase family metal-dependent hydrolase